MEENREKGRLKEKYMKVIKKDMRWDSKVGEDIVRDRKEREERIRVMIPPVYNKREGKKIMI